MTLPPADTNAICEQDFRDETVMGPDAAIAEHAQKLSDIDTSTIAGAVPEAALTKVARDEGSSWLRRPAPGAAPGALYKLGGVWKRPIQVLTTRKAHVDHLCPIAKTSFVYYDDEVYDSVLTEKSTDITYVTQLIFDSETKVYYVYYRWGETDYKLHGPYETVESAKEAFQVNYKEKFDIEWAERETTAIEKWTYEVKTYESFEETEDVEEIIEDTQAELIIAREKEIVRENTKITEEPTATLTEEVATVEHATKKETVAVEEETETEKEVVIREIGVVAEPAVPEKSFWKSALTGAGVAVVAARALTAGAGVDWVSKGNDDEDFDPFALEKTRTLADGKRAGSAGLSVTAMAAVVGIANIQNNQGPTRS